MSTLAELIAHRATAVTAYSDALAAFKTAYVNLAALDATLANRNVGYGQPVATFAAAPFGPSGPSHVVGPNVFPFRHPVASPNFTASWDDEINAQLRTRLAAFPTPDE